jgi:hypothetical protein
MRRLRGTAALQPIKLWVSRLIMTKLPRESFEFDSLVLRLVCIVRGAGLSPRIRGAERGTIMDLLVEQIRALDAYSKKHGISRAETIRRAVAMFLPNLKYVQPQKAVRMAPAVYRSFAARTSTFSMLGEVASSSGAFAMSAAAIFPER